MRGKLSKSQLLRRDYAVEVESVKYLIDLNRDGTREKIVLIKRDGLDFFMIKDAFGRVILEEKLRAKGGESRIYKIDFRTLSTQTDVMILYFYEGLLSAVNFEAAARIYMVTIDKRDLGSLSMTEGPHYFHEFQMVKNKYGRRSHRVDLSDLNKDGVKEVLVRYSGTQSVWMYQGKGNWKQI